VSIGSGRDGPLAEAFGDDRRRALVEVGLGEHDRELLAAVAAGDVAAAQAAEDALGDAVLRTSSPTEWPWLSLTCLKWSMSIISTLIGWR
jgi:hypothetical protein